MTNLGDFISIRDLRCLDTTNASVLEEYLWFIDDGRLFVIHKFGYIVSRFI